MKSLLTSILLFFVFSNLNNAQTDCKPYVPTEKGNQWELTSFNAKGKETGKISYEVLDKVVDGNTVSYKIKSHTFDKKGKQIFESEFEAKCIDGVFDMSMAMKMDGNQLKQYENMDIEVDASSFEIPEFNTAPGTTLENGTLTVNTGGDSPISFTMTVEVTERKVDSKETLTTPAGSYDCIVITQNIGTKMIVRIKSSSKEWYAENVGLVKSETYNKKGKLMGYSLITKFEN